MSCAFRSLPTQALRWALPALACVAIVHGGPAGADTRAGAPTAPLRKLNPAPTQAYEIRLTLAQVADLPAGADRQAPFAEVAGTAQFDVGNAAGCGKSDPRIGQVPTLSSHEPFRMTRVSATEYVGTIHADQLVDEDYYGRGVCHWKLTEVRVALRAGTDPADTRFVSALAARQVLAGQAQTRHFWKGYYPRYGQGGSGDFGRQDLASVPADQRNAFFTTTLTARKTGP